MSARLRLLLAAITLSTYLYYFLHTAEGAILDPKINRLRLSEGALQNMKRLHYNWYLYSLKALMVQISKGMLKKVDQKVSRQFLRCLSRINKVREIERSARCLVEAKNSYMISKSIPASNNTQSEAFIRKKRSPYRLVEPKKLRRIKTMSKAPSLQSSKQLVKTVTKLFTTLFTNSSFADIPQNWDSTYKKMKRMQKKLEDQEKSESAKVYKYRMYDIVLDRTGRRSDSDPWQNIFSLADAFGGKETSFSVLSPRIMPVMPNAKGRKGILSPSLFPLYHDETEQQILPIPKILDKWGLSESDRNSILQMIMEISGARQTAEDAMNLLENMSTFGVGDAIFKATGELSKTFDQLRGSFDKNQRRALEKRGYTIMNSKQMKRFHDEVGITGKQSELNYDDYGTLSRSQRHESLWNVIESIASPQRRRRVKRQIKPVSVLAPTFLAPYMFAPVYGFSVLGPVVLSPNIFSPLILNPSVLGPWVLSPSVPLPFILSPYLLSPYVLSPLAMAPFILSPYVLSPNVINPYLLAPVILSPVVLCPDLLSPMALSGPILSPGVLSPSILSKSAIMANVLSPSILS